MAREGALRRIDKTRLRAVVGNNNMAAARRLAGDEATPKQIEDRRNEILRYLRPEGSSSASLYMTEGKANEYAAAFGVTPDAFLEPVRTALEREIARLRARLQRLESEQAAGRERDPRDV